MNICTEIDYYCFSALLTYILWLFYTNPPSYLLTSASFEKLDFNLLLSRLTESGICDL